MKKNFLWYNIIIIISILIWTLQGNEAYGNKQNFLDENKSNEFIVCIDPGHQSKADFKSEPVAPGSSNRKSRVSAGTEGIGSKKAEYEINMEASLILKDLLMQKGYNVIMTRDSNDVNISNAERAEIANNAKADITVRIHCDSLNDSSKTGASILVPSKLEKHTAEIYEESNRYASILKEKLKNHGIKVNGIFERNDITGFNWSKVPVIILEMGFISNYEEDKMLNDTKYQRKIMESVMDSVDEYKLMRVSR